MNWENYRKYYEKMSIIERSLIRKRLREWIDGHGSGDKKADEHWGTTEANIAQDMFEAGWIAARIEIGDDPILKV